MKLHLQCFSPVPWGESVWITGSIKQLGQWDLKQAIPLLCFDGKNWITEIELEEDSLEYRFVIRNTKGEMFPEKGSVRKFAASSLCKGEIMVSHQWQSPDKVQKAMESSVFTKAVFGRPAGKSKKNKKSSSDGVCLHFEVSAVRIQRHETLFLCGNIPALGEWDTNNAIEMDGSKFPVWDAKVSLKQTKGIVEYKYLVKDSKSGKIIRWESGPNRQQIVSDNQAFSLYIKDNPFRDPEPAWKGAGVSIPVFSLRTENSFGVGEFTDLKSMVDWAYLTGLSMIQVLPVNDTISTNTFLDSYPYKAISVFALHPIYLNVFEAGKLKSAKRMKEYHKTANILNQLPQVDYLEVMEQKMSYCHELFDQEKETFPDSKEFQSFLKQNNYWLKPYAAFCYLRKKHHTADFSKWKKDATFDIKRIDKYAKPGSEAWDEILFQYFLQYHLDKQLKDVSAYGREHGVGLKGDIPIGISRFSVDAWSNPELYYFKQQAGAPPDDFSVEGQNWGFPTYNWSRMREDGYTWWHQRLGKMADYFDAYRIDHILGFFRIWEIPLHAVQGLLGHFRPSLPFNQEELSNWGIGFDHQRYCKPYIRGHMLQQIFGSQESLVREKYLNETSLGIFELKQEFATQQKVYEHFIEEGKGPEDLNEAHAIQYNGLLKLIAEVILIEDEEQLGMYHPRISMFSTASFAELDVYHKDRFAQLYNHFFYYRHEDFWRSKAEKKLPGLAEATDMLVCGEDLGMIPASVPKVMDELGILSLEIQRMPKDPKREFAHPGDAPYLSVCTTSTHDMSTIRGWWEENGEVSQRFFNTQLHQNGEKPFYAEPWLCEQILVQHLKSPAMWTIFPLQDLLAIDGEIRNSDTHGERINVPANPRHYWRYRMHMSIEELMNKTQFNEKLRELIKQNER